MPEVLAAALLPVVLYCTVRAVSGRPRGGGETGGHHRDLDVWHALMGAAMVAMALGRLPAGAIVPVLVLSVLAVGWGLHAVERTSSAAAYARLAVGGAAMAVMAPSAPAAAAVAEPGAGHAMAAMGHDLWVPLGVALLVVLASAALTAGPALARTGDLVRRLDACCDVVMAAAMTVMLVQML